MENLPVPEWKGRPSELLKELNSILTKRNEDPKEKVGWPKAPNKLKEAVQRVAPNLRAIGIDVECGRTNGTRLMAITKKPKKL
jgi:hypothetical protein